MNDDVEQTVIARRDARIRALEIALTMALTHAQEHMSIGDFERYCAAIKEKECHNEDR